MRSALAAAMMIGTTLTAAADTGAVIAIPGKAGVPVLINRRDASYAVVEGDWGLAKSVHVQPTIIGGGRPDVVPEVGHYYPSAGHLPGYGRLEISPPDNRPQQADSYRRSWSVQSAEPLIQPPANPPPIIVAPQFDMPGGGKGGGGGKRGGPGGF